MSKKEVLLSKANRLINSGSVILVTSAYKDKANIITLAWHTPLSHKPPILAISVADSHLSCELIKKSGEFIVNVPTAVLIKEVWFCGTNSGRDVDKFDKTKLTSQKADRLTKTHLIQECAGHLECFVRDIKSVGDHSLFIGEIIFAKAEEGLFDGSWDPKKSNLLYHLGADLFTTATEVIKAKSDT